MISLSEKINESVTFLQSYIIEYPKFCIVLGTGFDNITSSLTDVIQIDYSQIPHFPTSSVPSHQGKLIFGRLCKVPVVILSGRVHYYEGYTMQDVTFSIRVIAQLKVNQIIFTNAAGGINPHYHEGDIVMVSDHINFFSEHPLRGNHEASLGLRFPDMSDTYDSNTIDLFTNIAKGLNINLQLGVYFGWQGPSLETPAEYKMIRILGGDLVGMSTIPEVIVAKQSGMKISVFSIVSNVCFPLSRIKKSTVEEIIDVVKNSANKLLLLLENYSKSIQ